MFRDLIPELDNHFHVVAPDYPGMGYSDAPSAETFAANDDSLTAVVEGFVQQLGNTRLILYMQDLGGPIGMRLATRHPEWVAGLIFQNTPISVAGWNPDRLKPLLVNTGPVTSEERAAAASRVVLDTAIFLYQRGARDPGGLNPDAWATDAYALSKSENRRIIAGYLADARLSLPLYPEWQAYLREKQPRTLVVWGKHDPVFSEAGIADIKNAVPSAEVHLYDTGHFALEEDSEDIAWQITQFFAIRPTTGAK
jgi:pimeloyl-ACP methyl ester carboxylesterase